MGTNQHGETDNIFSNFSIKAFQTAKNILNDLKLSKNDYETFLSNLQSSNELVNKKIIMN